MIRRKKKTKLLCWIVAVAMIASMMPLVSFGAVSDHSPQARIGNVYYGTLQKALDDAETGDIVTVLKDVTVSEDATEYAVTASNFGVAGQRTFTIDLNGKTVSNTSGDGDGICIMANNTVTIKNGTVSTSGRDVANNPNAAIYSIGENVYLEDVFVKGELEGTTGASNAIYVAGGRVTLISGEFLSVATDVLRIRGTGSIVLAENSVADFQDWVEANGGSFKVSIPQAKIGSTLYSTLTDAIGAAVNGDTIVLNSDISRAGAYFVDIDKSLTVDFDGYTITILGNGYFGSGDGQTVTLKDGNIVQDSTANWGVIAPSYGNIILDNMNVSRIYGSSTPATCCVLGGASRFGSSVIIKSGTFSGFEGSAAVNDSDSARSMVSLNPASAVSREDWKTAKSFTVEYRPVTGISLSGNTYVAAGSSLRITPTVTPSDAANKSVTWSSSSTSVATVSSTGLVTARRPGATTIRVTAADGSGISKSKTIIVVPKKMTLTKVRTPRAGQLTAYWTKDSTVSGYQVYVARNSSFTSGAKATTVASYKYVSKTITSLSKGKRYYVKVRAYKIISGKKYYGAWSNIKYITVRK